MMRRIWAIVALSLVLQPALATFQNDFSKYPTASQDCLYKASNSSNCDGDTMIEMNDCLCGNGGDFVTNAAACLGTDDPDDLDDVFTTMSAACTWSGTPLAVSEDGFMSAANGSTTASSSSSTSSSSTKSSSSTTSKPTTTTDAKTTASSTTYTTTSNGQVMTITTTGAVPTNTGDSGNKGSDNSTAKIGIIAGASVAGVAIIAIAAFMLLWYRRKRRGDGVTTLASSSGGKYSQVSSGTELSPYSAYDEWKASAAGDPKWRASTATAATTPGMLSTEWAATPQHPQEQVYAYELPVQSAAQSTQPVELAAPGPTAPGPSSYATPYSSPYGTPQVPGQR